MDSLGGKEGGGKVGGKEREISMNKWKIMNNMNPSEGSSKPSKSQQMTWMLGRGFYCEKLERMELLIWGDIGVGKL